MAVTQSQVKHDFQAPGPVKHLERLNRAHESKQMENYVEISVRFTLHP